MLRDFRGIWRLLLLHDATSQERAQRCLDGEKSMFISVIVADGRSRKGKGCMPTGIMQLSKYCRPWTLHRRPIASARNEQEQAGTRTGRRRAFRTLDKLAQTHAEEGEQFAQ